MQRLAVVAVLAFSFGCQQGTDAPKQQSKRVEVPDEKPKNVGDKPPTTQKAAAKQIPPPFDVVTPPADAQKFESGLVFKPITEGTGATPGRNDQVKIHYSAWRPDGQTFATTDGAAEPTSMFLFSSAPGFAEALTKMKVGGKAMFWLPPAIGYPGKPRDNAEQLAYAVELKEVIAAPATPPDVAKAPADVKTTKEGVKWKVLKAGDGDQARAWDMVHLSFTGWDATGRIVDSSEVYGKPVKAPLDQLPPLFQGVLPEITVGTRVRMWFPASLLGPARPGGPAGELCFEVSLNEITRRAEPPKAPADVAAPPADALKTPKGVAYKVLKRGTGSVKPAPTDRVKVHYSGWHTDGKLFQSSRQDGEPKEFAVNGVITGWTEILPLMVEGDVFQIWVPEELAYKGAPNKPQGMLVFEMELMSIVPPKGKPAK